MKKYKNNNHNNLIHNSKKDLNNSNKLYLTIY